MKKSSTLLLALMVIGSANVNATVLFSPFVTASDISAVLGQTNTIAFNYAGNKFIGSVYFGANNLQLFSTDLSGGNVQKFGAPLPTGVGEVVVAASLGLGGFAKGDVYAGPDNHIYHYSNSGGSPTLFASTLDGSVVRQILFDPGSSFNGNMLVSTTSGKIYSITGTGIVSEVASVGEDTEGLDIASSKYGKYAGQLLVTSEHSGKVRAISAGGVVTELKLRDVGGAPITLPNAETVSVVPLNLGVSGNPIEGFYVANYPVDIQVAPAIQFAGLEGDAIVTGEFGANSPVWDLFYNGDVLDTFTVTQVGTLPNQSEDGIFVTAERIIDVNPTPEPASVLLIAAGLLGLARRRQRI